MNYYDFLESFDIDTVSKALVYFGISKKSGFMNTSSFRLSFREARKAIAKKRQEIDSLKISNDVKQLLLKDFEKLKKALYCYVLTYVVEDIRKARISNAICTEAEVAGNVFLIWNSLFRENPDWLLSFYTAVSLLITDLLRQNQKNKANKYTRLAQIISKNCDLSR